VSDNLIFGHTWEDINRAQRGGHLSRPILNHQPNPTATQADAELLAKHGKDGLVAMGFFGVLDRLETSGLL
jgi:hypothetical protein